MFALSHIDMMPLFYGCLMFLGIWSMYYKVTRGNIKGFVIEASVFSLVFFLHGGTMNGGFAAMVCALLAGLVLGRKRRTA
jgi:hypothetical protein